MRAVAVLAVLAYHAHYGWGAGGYLGVDVFFVLSGFLITRVLLSTHRSWWGYRQFLARRAVRLVPALVVAVAGMTVVALLTGLPAPLVGRCGGASLGYAMNLPFLERWHCPAMWHITWSLAAEQQFYLLWPLALAGLAVTLRALRPLVRRVGVSPRRGAFLVVGLLAVALWLVSLVGQAVRLAHGVPTSRVAFAPDGRSLVLLLGCGLALLAARRVPGRAPLRPAVADRAALGAVVVLLGCFGFGGMASGVSALLPIVLAGVASLVLVAAAAHAPRRSGVDAVLGARPVAWLGRISYSLYLWHEVAYRLAEQVAPRGSLVAEVLRFVLALALAAASHRWVEQRAQQWWRDRRVPDRPDAGLVLVATA